MNNEHLIHDNNLIFVKNEEGKHYYKPSQELFVLNYYWSIHKISYVIYIEEFFSDPSINVDLECRIVYPRDEDIFNNDYGSLFYIPDNMIISDNLDVLIRKIENLKYLE